MKIISMANNRAPQGTHAPRGSRTVAPANESADASPRQRWYLRSLASKTGLNVDFQTAKLGRKAASDLIELLTSTAATHTDKVAAIEAALGESVARNGIGDLIEQALALEAARSCGPITLNKQVQRVIAAAKKVGAK